MNYQSAYTGAINKCVATIRNQHSRIAGLCSVDHTFNNQQNANDAPILEFIVACGYQMPPSVGTDSDRIAINGSFESPTSFILTARRFY
jgi:hypothetical protein